MGVVSGNGRNRRDRTCRLRRRRWRRGAAAPAAVSPITRAGGAQGNGDSDLGFALSQTGQFVAFSSGASNLVAGDTNGVYDVFLFDRQTGTTTRVSVGLGVPPLQADGDSTFPSISADGRYVAFESLAENLVGPGQDTNLKSDIFVRDRTLAVTERASVALAGFPTQPDGDSFNPSISADGRYVVFYSFATNLVAGDTNGATDVFLYDRTLATTTRVSVGPGGVQGNDNSVVFGQAVSNDGTRVAFESAATNLVAGDTNGVKDVFVRDRTAGTTTRVSVDNTGAQANGESRVSAISGNGRYVVFESDATNLVANDNNGVTDIFVRDLTAGTTTRVSVDNTGAQANGASFALGSTTISDDGRHHRVRVGRHEPGDGGHQRRRRRLRPRHGEQNDEAAEHHLRLRPADHHLHGGGGQPGRHDRRVRLVRSGVRHGQPVGVLQRLHSRRSVSGSEAGGLFLARLERVD